MPMIFLIFLYRTTLNGARLLISLLVKEQDIKMTIETGNIIENLSLISNFLMIINSSSNFFVYVFTDDK